MASSQEFTNVVQEKDSIVKPRRSINKWFTLTTEKVLNQQAFINSCGIPFGAVLDFAPSSKSNLARIYKAPIQCGSCGGYLNPFCKINLQKALWACTFCGTTNVSTNSITIPEAEAYPELCEDGVEYVQHSQGPRPCSPPHVVLVLDASLEPASMAELRATLLPFISSLDPATLVSIISFDSALCIHSLTDALEVSATCLPPSQVDAASACIAFAESADICQPAGSVPANVYDRILSSVRPLEDSVPQLQRRRATVSAIEAAVRLVAWRANGGSLSTPAPQSLARCRVIALVGGPITAGPGAQAVSTQGGKLERSSEALVKEAEQHVRALANMAAVAGLSVDIFSGNQGPVSAPLLQHLAQSSGGDLVLLHSFGPALLPALRSVLTRFHGRCAWLDAHTSSGVRVAQWLGPVTYSLPGGSASDHWVFAGLTKSAVRALRLEEGRAAALRLELGKDLVAGKEQYVYVQVILAFEDEEGSLIRRVLTQRLEVTQSLSSFLSALEPTATGVLAARRLLAEVTRTGGKDGSLNSALLSDAKVEEARGMVAALLSLIASRCGKALPPRGGFLGFGRTALTQLPPALHPLAQALHALIRGPLLGNCPSPEVRCVLISHFMRGSLSLAANLMSPSLYALLPPRPSETPTEDIPPWGLVPLTLPPVTLAAAQHRSHVMLLDTGCEVWVRLAEDGGSAMDDQACLACHQLLARFTSSRYPTPEDRLITAGSSGDIEFFSRLSPVDEAERILQLFQLPSLPADPEVRSALTSVPQFEGQTLSAWARHYGIVLHPEVDP